MDARRFQRNALLINGLIYAHYGAVVFSLVPPWTLLLTLPVLVVRWMLSVHELFHLRNPQEVDPLTRLLPLAFTPLMLGYSEYRSMHFGHHRHHGTVEDPEHFHIRGSKFAGFLNALSAPEQSYFRWIAKHGMSPELALGSVVRLLLFACLIILGGKLFLWYWIPLRIAYAISYFSFFYCLHRRGPEHGVYPLTLPVWVQRIFALLYSQDALHATCYHHVHHDHAVIAARHLAEASRSRS